jgi:hypothetical protein
MFDSRAIRIIPLSHDARITLVPRLFPEEDLIECMRGIAPHDCVSAIAAVYDADEILEIANELLELSAYLRGEN